MPVVCNQCKDAKCISACPTDAIYKKNGVVKIRHDDCVGCHACVEACPFGAMQFDDEGEIAVKCDMCVERLNNDERPACSQACGTQCIFWGDTKALSERVVAERSVL